MSEELLFQIKLIRIKLSEKRAVLCVSILLFLFFNLQINLPLSLIQNLTARLDVLRL